MSHRDPCEEYLSSYICMLVNVRWPHFEIEGKPTGFYGGEINGADCDLSKYWMVEYTLKSSNASGGWGDREGDKMACVFSVKPCV